MITYAHTEEHFAKHVRTRIHGYDIFQNIFTGHCKTSNIYPSKILIELELFESDCQVDAY